MGPRAQGSFEKGWGVIWWYSVLRGAKSNEEKFWSKMIDARGAREKF